MAKKSNLSNLSNFLLHPALHDKNYAVTNGPKMIEWDNLYTIMFVYNNPELCKILFTPQQLNQIKQLVIEE